MILQELSVGHELLGGAELGDEHPHQRVPEAPALPSEFGMTHEFSRHPARERFGGRELFKELVHRLLPLFPVRGVGGLRFGEFLLRLRQPLGTAGELALQLAVCFEQLLGVPEFAESLVFAVAAVRDGGCPADFIRGRFVLGRCRDVLFFEDCRLSFLILFARRLSLFLHPLHL